MNARNFRIGALLAFLLFVVFLLLAAREVYISFVFGLISVICATFLIDLC